MKAILLILLFPLLLCVSSVSAQTAWQGLNFQAVIRDPTTQGIIANTSVNMRYSVLPSKTGSAVYEETTSAITSAQGIVNGQIGQGTVTSGSWDAIPWSTGSVFLKVEMAVANDPFTTLSTVQFFAVPYAIYALNGGTGTGTGGGGTGTGIYWQGTLTSAPATATLNHAYYNSTDHKSYIYDSLGVWQIMAQDGTSLTWLGQFTTEPTGAVFNQAYYNMTDKKSYVYDGSAWQIIAQDGIDGNTITWLGTLTAAPDPATINDAYYNSTDKKSYIYDGSAWQVLAQDGTSGTGVTWLGTLTAAPATANLNEAYYNSTDKVSYIYDGTTWQILTQDGLSGTGVTWLGTLATAPATATLNQAYYNATDKVSYIYDGTTWQVLTQDGIQGVGISWLGSFATAPTTPTLNQAYYNSTDRTAYIYDGTAWQVLAEGGTGWTLSTLDYETSGQLGIKTTVADTLKATKKVWLTSGNTGTDSNSDFIGTLDDVALAIKTGGNGTTQERIHFTTTPRMFVNGTADTASSQGQAVFTVFGGGAPLALNSSGASMDHAINGYNSNSTAAIYGRNYSNGYGIQGVSSAGAGVYGWSNSKGSIPIKGENQSSIGGFGMIGLIRTQLFYGGNTLSAGVLGWSQSTTGGGVLGVGNNLDYTSQTLMHAPDKGAGVTGIGMYFGTVGIGGVSNITAGVGVAGAGNNQDVIAPTTGGAGVTGYGYIGVAGYGRSSTSTGDAGRWGGYFESRYATTGAAIGYMYVAGQQTAGTFVGYVTSGSKSTVVKDQTGTPRMLYCTESPEILFQDFGAGELVNGKAHIDLEQLLTEHIRVDAKHPLKVFIQLEGDCNGVFVTNKSATGFDVKELQNGQSNVSFTWQIVASRADEVTADGGVLNYSDQRFAVGPSALPSVVVGRGDSTAVDSAAVEPEKVILKKEEASVVEKAFSNLQFESAKADIAKSSFSSLNKLADLLKAHAEWHVKLSGHTDNEGTAIFNMALSENRSEAVKNYLTSKGVDAGHITTIGYGQTQPLSTENTKVAKEKNRRVEIAIYAERP